VHEVALADWERVMAVNSTAVFLCTKHAVLHLRAAGAGSIVNISSIYAMIGSGGVPPYHAAKGRRAVDDEERRGDLRARSRPGRLDPPGFVFTDMLRGSTERAQVRWSKSPRTQAT
jgi:hypothetical protein